MFLCYHIMQIRGNKFKKHLKFALLREFNREKLEMSLLKKQSMIIKMLFLIFIFPINRKLYPL